MFSLQASTENAEAFDRLNRRLDNEVKNFTAMVKEVATNIKISIKVLLQIPPYEQHEDLETDLHLSQYNRCTISLVASMKKIVSSTTTFCVTDHYSQF